MTTPRAAVVILAVLALATAACSRSSSPTTETTVSPPPTAAPTSTSTTVAPTTSGSDGETTTTTTRPRPTTTTTTTAADAERAGNPRRTTTTTTTRPRAASDPPSVSISSPGSGSRFAATYDQSRGAFGAFVTFVAEAFDPNGDPVAIEWSSSGHGFLGSGNSITVWLSTPRDTSQPMITARAVDPSGASSSASVQIIVWIPSDQ